MENQHNSQDATASPLKDKTENLNFGLALLFLKQGKAVTRESWQNESICVSLRKGNYDFNREDELQPKSPITHIEGLSIELFDNGAKGTVTRLPNLELRNRYGSTVVFAPGNDSLLAEDWYVIGENDPK